MCEKALELAMGGNMAALQWIVERLEGKAAQSIELSKKESLLQGLPDADILELIEIIKRKRLASGNNNGDNA